MYDALRPPAPDTVGVPSSDQPRVPDANRHFTFIHRVFSAPGAVFKLDANSGEPVFALDLGNVKATLPFPALTRAFEIARDSPDARQLDAVAKGLRYVRRIRPGDSIPAELLDGSASWKVDQRHVAIAKGKLFASLLAAIGRPPEGVGKRDFALLAEDESLAPAMRDAYTMLAGRMGLEASLTGDAEAIVDGLAEEFAYIEALRERVAQTRGLIDTLVKQRESYRRDRTMADHVRRTIQLLERPVLGYERRLHLFDMSVADPVETVINMSQRIGVAREVRDGLHADLMRWDDLLALWADAAVMGSARSMSARLGETYRFAARNFPIASDWTTG